MPRRLSPELMDDPALDPDAHRRALRGLARLNLISRSATIVFHALRDLLPARPAPPLSVLDLATGGGDIAIGLARLAQRHGLAIDVTGADVSGIALDFARSRADAGGLSIRFVQLDALRDPLPPADVVTCSLFMHHLSDGDGSELLRRMAQAARWRVIVNDLCRSRLTMAGVALSSRLVTRSPVVHADALLSVRAAYTLAEARALAERAGISGAVVRARFPARFLLTWDKR